jgi:two-component system LytT family response regulator
VNEVLDSPDIGSVDILFLDMEMPVMSGFELLSQLQLNANCQIVVVTAYDNYALEAYQNEALAYLVKPVQAEELIKVVRKARQFTADSSNSSDPELISKNSKRIKVYDNDEYNLLDIEDLIRLEANGNYTHLYTKERSYISTIRIGTYESQLTDHGFFRVHRSHLINLKHLKKIGKASDAYITMEKDSNIPISTTKRNELLKLI